MLYRIRRTSLWDEKTPPCKGAERRKCIRVDARTCKSAKEFDRDVTSRFGDKPWRSEGRNHRVVKDGIEREFDYEDWFIEITDLVEFARKHGELVLGFRHRDPYIEIYDDYRE